MALIKKVFHAVSAYFADNGPSEKERYIECRKRLIEAGILDTRRLYH
ncbi:MAG TPA: hypothetical protein VFK51_02975 [Burkholderiales bacterium]|jgi:hypothetical protein|nr:hypothetical protein [Burkholderiales bacterium]